MSAPARAVVIVTCERDLAINRLSVPEVIAHMAADEYQVIVPDGELARFRTALPARASIVPESSLLSGWTLSAIARQLPPATAGRAGWYLQQILKMQALAALPAGSNAVIWDGDTIPLRSPVFVDDADRVGFYVGTERHAPYFATIARLLGIERAIAGSFIAQCMYVRVGWIHELIASLEQRAARPWVEALLAAITGQSPSEFSEYETIGTFAFRRHADQCFVNHRPWFRFGTAYCGGLDRITPAHLRRLAGLFDFAAFERWDTGMRAAVRCRFRLLQRRFGTPATPQVNERLPGRAPLDLEHAHAARARPDHQRE